MKVVYLLAFAAICLMFATIFIAKEEQNKIVRNYYEECNKFGGSVYVTKDSDGDDVVLCVNTDLFLLKPYKLEELVDKVRESL